MSGLDRALSFAKKKFCQPTEMEIDPDLGMEILPMESENEKNPENDAIEGNSLDNSIFQF